MKFVGFALIAALAIGCGVSPTSPTASAGSIATMSSEDAKAGHGQTTKVTLYFYYPLGGKRLEGLPVTLTGIPDGPTVTAVTDRQSSVTISVPRNTTGVAWQVFANSGGFCPASGELTLPFGVRGNWFPIDIRPDCVAP